MRSSSDGTQRVFTSMEFPSVIGRPLLNPPFNTHQTVANGGQYPPEGTWVALRDGAVVAPAAYRGGPDDNAPRVLDWFGFTDYHAAVTLLRHAATRPRGHAAGVRAGPACSLARESGRAAGRAAGDRRDKRGRVHHLTERYRYEWRPDCGLPRRSERLEFRPEPRDEVVLSVLRRVHSDTLDAHAQRAIATGGTDLAAQEELDVFRWCSSPREWWRLAYTPDGPGVHVPAHHPNDPCVGFIGMVPEQRGHGHAYGLLAECTHQLAEQGARRIAAATDVSNVPMAAAFAKAGYPVVQQRFCMV